MAKENIMVSQVASDNVNIIKKNTLASSVYLFIKFNKKKIKIQNNSLKIKNSFKLWLEKKKYIEVINTKNNKKK